MEIMQREPPALKLCKCGCGTMVMSKLLDYLPGHLEAMKQTPPQEEQLPHKDEKIKEPRLCQCGCGAVLKDKRLNFIKGHRAALYKRTEPAPEKDTPAEVSPASVVPEKPPETPKQEEIPKIPEKNQDAETEKSPGCDIEGDQDDLNGLEGYDPAESAEMSEGIQTDEPAQINPDDMVQAEPAEPDKELDLEQRLLSMGFLKKNEIEPQPIKPADPPKIEVKPEPKKKQSWLSRIFRKEKLPQKPATMEEILLNLPRWAVKEKKPLLMSKDKMQKYIQFVGVSKNRAPVCSWLLWNGVYVSLPCDDGVERVFEPPHDIKGDVFFYDLDRKKPLIDNSPAGDDAHETLRMGQVRNIAYTLGLRAGAKDLLKNLNLLILLIGICILGIVILAVLSYTNMKDTEAAVSLLTNMSRSGAIKG